MNSVIERMGQASLASAEEKAAALIGGRYQVERFRPGRRGCGLRGDRSRQRHHHRAQAAGGDANDKTHALFEREYRTLSGLRNPCIVEVYDYGTDRGGAYYTMELLDDLVA